MVLFFLSMKSLKQGTLLPIKNIYLIDGIDAVVFILNWTRCCCWCEFVIAEMHLA